MSGDYRSHAIEVNLDPDPELDVAVALALRSEYGRAFRESLQQTVRQSDGPERVRKELERAHAKGLVAALGVLACAGGGAFTSTWNGEGEHWSVKCTKRGEQGE